ncbi:MAG: peptidase C39 family protein [Nanoarchaeota archaeon]|nr:peptidase C39 family protein [Nanoarchaeota archaeon]
MKLNVPFYRQTGSQNCGPVALKMVLSYFGDSRNVEELEELSGAKDGKGVSTMQIAVAAGLLGYRVDLFSKYLLFNEDNLKHDYYKNYSDMDVEQSKKWLEIARVAGVNVEEKVLSLEELLGFISERTIPIVLLDWNVAMGRKEKGYQGHFVPVVGYDDRNVYIHNHGLSDTQEFMPIAKGVFDEARKADGTDEDIVFIYKK